MAAIKPTYIPAPNWDILPDTGFIELGSIIKEPRNPLRSFNLPHTIPIESDKIITSVKRDWNLSRSQLLSGRIGLFSSFLAPLLGVGIDLAVHRSRDDSEMYKCQKLETKYFRPDAKYLAQSLKHDVVDAYVKRYPRRNLYMITGIKIARGASVQTTDTRGFGGEVKVNIDGTLVAAPVSGGPEVSLDKDKKVTVKFGASDDFILAYQVIKFCQKKDGSIEDKDFNKWALYSDEDDRESDPDYEALMATWDVEDLPHETSTEGLVPVGQDEDEGIFIMMRS